MGSGLFGVLSREYAPWSQRGAALLARIEGLPSWPEQALAALTGLPDRPVALLQLETALAQLGRRDRAGQSDRRRGARTRRLR